MSFSISSPILKNNEEIPSRYTAEGADISPPLSWQDPPVGTQSFVLIVDDPDAPDPEAPKTTWVHWVLYNIPSNSRELIEDVDDVATYSGILHGLNDWRRPDYGGANPPVGVHRYYHKLYALDTLLPDLHEPTKKQLLQCMQGHILAATKLMGTYQKH